MPQSPARTGSSPIRLRPILLGLIVLCAFVLRVTFNTYQLPPYWDYPNEIDKMVDVLALEELGFYHGYMQPSFLMNTMWLWYQPAQAVFPWINATFPGFRPLEGGMEGWLLWLGRVYMALFGAATVWLVYFVGRRIGSARLGLTAALLLAVTPIHVLGSRHMKEDMPLAFFVTLALLFLLEVVRRGARRDYLRAGLAAGLAFSTKWIGISILAPFLLAGLLAIPRTRRNWPAPGRRWLIPLVLAGFVAGFFLASPDYILAGRMNIIWEGPQKGMTKAYDAHADGIAVDAYREAYVDYFRKGIWPGLTPALIRYAYFTGQGRIPVFAHERELTAALRQAGSIQAFWRPWAGKQCTIEQEAPYLFQNALIDALRELAAAEPVLNTSLHSKSLSGTT